MLDDVNGSEEAPAETSVDAVLSPMEAWEALDDDNQTLLREIAANKIAGVPLSQLAILYDMSQEGLLAMFVTPAMIYVEAEVASDKLMKSHAGNASLDTLEARSIGILNKFVDEGNLELGETLQIAKFANSAIRRDSGGRDISADDLGGVGRVVVTLNTSYAEGFGKVAIETRKHDRGAIGVTSETEVPSIADFNASMTHMGAGTAAPKIRQDAQAAELVLTEEQEAEVAAMVESAMPQIR